MKTKMILGLSTLALSLSAQATNYKQCNKFLNPFQDFQTPEVASSEGSQGVSTNFGGGFGSGFGLGINPFSIEPDGKIKTAKGIKSYKHDKKKNIEIIEYEVPTFPYDVEPGKMPDYANMKPVMKVQKIIIHRDKNNDISKITRDLNVKQKEIDKHNKYMKKWYEYTYSDKYKKQMKEIQKQWGFKDFQAPMMMPLKTETHLSSVNGNCRIDRSTTTHLLENDLKNGYKYESIDFDTKLCKDLGKVVKKHQDKLKKCFSYEVGKDIGKIAKSFYESNQRENPYHNLGGFGGFGIGMGGYPGMSGGMGIGGGFGIGGGLGGMGMGYPGYGFMLQLENQVANMAFQIPYQSTPPIVQANQMYEMCRAQGLLAFEGEEFWPKAIPKSPPHGDDGAAGNNGADSSGQ